jgi:hypothetical protein
MDKNKTFFLDIFNQLLNYNEKQVMIVFDVDGNVWFKLKDLLKMLDYNDIKHRKSDINITSDFLNTIDKLKIVGGFTPPPHFHPKTQTVLYIY